ncbi:GIY-YIG catalytic domain-containing protein [Cytobacillus firmus]|uniref:GIY-YIG catalytic domain-containing protein n=2 Tax=Cytobacillus TaxID=2675230 RepID=A0A366JAZ7_CYTFI|nr:MULTISPECIES: GIY-YIG nuclease family protein [Cytobacillus]RBP84037.1 GIY-YIG catalytic domain-containing protein [Cytobacillus firmus]TDX47178.1 GIY-YIG catalytic domain-containing protein [Cytobacillus oceanisediminis]
MNVNFNLLKFSHDMEFPRTAGVYILENKKNDKVYIGSTRNVRARIASHRSLLLSGRHYSKELQQAFDSNHLSVAVIAVLPHASSQLLRESERLLIQASPYLFPAGILNKRLINYSK